MSADTVKRQPLLSITALSKHFGGVRALDGVDFELNAGEIHALLGENGAGKSTLIKVLAGVEKADSGTIAVEGNVHKGSGAPQGIQFVHQDLGLIDDLSVAENLALDVGYSKRMGLIHFGATERRATALLDEMGTDISAHQLVGELAQAERVMVAVTRAFSTNAKFIVLDEATASLPAPEVERLSTHLRNARASGMAFIFVTHRLDEIFGLCNSVTVLRDGKRVATAAVDTIDHGQVVEWIVGKQVQHTRKPSSTARPGAPLLEVHDLFGGLLTAPVSFSVLPGEVVALTGLIGCGARDVAQMLGGALTPVSGTATLEGSRLDLGDPRALASESCVYVPGDRQREGAIPLLTVRENLFPSRRNRDPRFLAPKAERHATRLLVERFRVRPVDCAERPLNTLSGGNQQKVIVGRALRADPRLVVLDDPTVGVDVGSRAELHVLLREAAGAGSGIVLASSDYDEVSTEADRVLVFRNGAVARELDGDEATRQLLAIESYIPEEEVVA